MQKSRVFVASAGALGALVIATGGLGVITPAQALSGMNWGHIWKKEIKPRADKRYYTKSDATARFASKQSLTNDYYTKDQSDSTFATKQSLSPYATRAELGNYATNATLANYALKTDSYTKAQSDARYVAQTSQYSGIFYVAGDNTSSGFALLSGQISFPAPLASAPSVVVVAVGGTSTTCTGTVAAPTAPSGTLCVYLKSEENVNPGTAQTAGNGFLIVDPTGNTDPGASTLGAGIRVEATATSGHVAAYGSWALGR